MTLPVPNSTLPFWRQRLDEIDSYRSTAELPSATDIVIIGAGFAGAASAHYLLKDNPNPPSITILEARQVCSGATGRNGGHVKPSTYSNVARNIELHGEEAALEVAQFEASQLWAVKELVETENIDCDFYVTRGIDVLMDEGVALPTEETYRKLRAEKLVPDDVQFIPKKDVERITGVKGGKCAFSSTAAHIWPYKLVTHLLGRALERGTNLQTTTPVTSVSSEPDASGCWIVSTPRGSIAARKVIFSTNAYTAGLIPAYKDKIIPVRGICSRIDTPKGPGSPNLPNTYSFRWNRGFYDYLIPRPDGSIIVGGARQAYLADKSHWYDVTDDSRLIEPAKHYFDGYMQRYFRGWEDSEAEVSHIWTGIMGYSADFKPHVGEVPGKKEQIIIAGFSGHGMPQILMCAQGVAEMVRDGRSIEDTKVPKVFRTTKERLENPRNLVLEYL